jgi:hypothetical protein
MRMRQTIFPVIALALLGAAGCYHYVPATVTMERQGAPLRTRLNTMAAFELSAITVNNIDVVEGEMVRVDGGDLVLSATWLQAVTGNGFPGNGWTVRIPESNVASVERRSFSWWRSGIVIGAIGAMTYWGFESLGFGSGGSGGGGGGGPPL